MRATGVPFTIVRPAGFLSNVLAWAGSIKAQGQVRACTGEGKVAYIHPEDIAEVTAKVLLTGKPKGESLEITGPEALSYAEMTSRISTRIGRPLGFEAISDNEALKRLTAHSVAANEAEALVRLWGAIRAGRLAIVTRRRTPAGQEADFV